MDARQDRSRARTPRAGPSIARNFSHTAAARQEITALTGLRGLAAVWVFLYHAQVLTKDLDESVTWPLRFVASAGYLGVDLFFVLSGFVISYNYAHEDLHRSLRRYAFFLWKRLARIWPAHTAALLFFAAGLAIYPVAFDLSFAGFLKSLTLMQAWAFPAHQIWNPVAWSVSCEWAVYLVFPLIALSTRALPLPLAAIGIACCYLALYGAFVIGPWGDGPYSLGLQRVAASFTAGVLVYRIWSKRREPINTAGWFAVVALILGTSCIDMIAGRSLSVAKAPILGCAVVYTLACATGSLSHTFQRLRYAGCISYSFYLVHWVGVALAHTVLMAVGASHSVPGVYVAVVASLLIAIAMADFFYRHIERPAQRLMLTLLQDDPSRRRGDHPRLRRVLACFSDKHRPLDHAAGHQPSEPCPPQSTRRKTGSTQ
ncbi:MAG: acyltransferase [Steroidobacteraceae bacterium]